MKRLGGVLLLAAALAGCGPPVFATDKDLCDAACATLINCGVQGLGDKAACSSGCQAPASSIFLACAKMGNALDCNSMSLCTIKQFCRGLAPAGTNSCALTQSCELNCGNDSACACACLSAMAPSHSRNIVLNNTCVNVNCAGCANATSCGICIQGRCGTQVAQCQSS